MYKSMLIVTPARRPKLRRLPAPTTLSSKKAVIAADTTRAGFFLVKAEIAEKDRT